MNENIIPALEKLTVDINSININQANTRKHEPDGIELLEQSLNTYGQHKPIVVQKSNMICRAGNGLLTAAKNLGWEKIAAVIIDEDSTTAVAREIIDNKSAEVGSLWDEENLLAQIQALQEDVNFNIENIGFSDLELNMLIEDIEPNILPEPEINEKEIDETIETENECPKCGYKW